MTENGRRLERAVDLGGRLARLRRDLDDMEIIVKDEVLAALSAVLHEEAADMEKKSSGKPCGCDPKAKWICERHQTQEMR